MYSILNTSLKAQFYTTVQVHQLAQLVLFSTVDLSVKSVKSFEFSFLGIDLENTAVM